MTDLTPVFRDADLSAIVTVECETCGRELPVERIREHLKNECKEGPR